MNNFFPTFILLLLSLSSTIAQDFKDCENPLMLCGESPFFLFPLEGTGNSDDGISETCLLQEYQSTWIELNVTGGGDLIFEITPAAEETDIDFIVFKLASGDCDAKSVIRCMASGESGGQSAEANQPCLGATGLAYGETDTEELPGCSTGSNNFLAPIEAEAGDQYMILINNFSLEEDTLSFSLGGTAELDCITTNTENINLENTTSLFKILHDGNQIIAETQSFEGPAKLVLISSNGSRVYENDVNKHEQISLSKSIPNGTYFLVMKTQEATQTEKVIIAR